MNLNTDPASSRSEVYQLCMQELDRGDLRARAPARARA
jgi:hypothetical protein